MSVLNNYIIENNNKQRATINHNDNDLKNNKIHTINTKEINVKEVNNNMECGLNIKNYANIQVGDIVEAFEELEVKRTL